MTHGVFDVRDFGATGDNSTDDTAAFTAALSAAEGLPSGGAVLVPPGRYYVDQIKMRTQCTLQGFGPSSVIRQNSGITTPLICLDTDDTNFTVLRDLRLRGNKYGGGGQGSAHGIDYENSEDSADIKAAELFNFHGDAQHRIFNVTIDAVDGIGMRLLTRETQVANCMIGDVTKDGLILDGSDNWVCSTSVNWVGRRGVVLNGGNNRLSAVKAWYVGTDETYQEADGFAILASRQTLVGCEAQDISRYGLYLKGADYCQISGMMLDNIGNFKLTQDQGFDHPPLVSGIVLTRENESNRCSRNRVDAVVAQRSSSSNLNSFVLFGNGSFNNSVNVSGNVEAHILTERTVVRRDHETTFDNIATVNGKAA